MREELYADGIAEITVTGTIVRIDFVSLSHTERDAHNNPVPVVRQRVIMPGDAFVEAVKLMQRAASSLADGRPADRGAPADRGTVHPIREVTPSGSMEPLARNVSPNFN